MLALSVISSQSGQDGRAPFSIALRVRNFYLKRGGHLVVYGLASDPLNNLSLSP